MDKIDKIDLAATVHHIRCVNYNSNENAAYVGQQKNPPMFPSFIQMMKTCFFSLMISSNYYFN